jgi:hypothetical protein
MAHPTHVEQVNFRGHSHSARHFEQNAMAPTPVEWQLLKYGISTILTHAC